MIQATISDIIISMLMTAATGFIIGYLIGYVRGRIEVEKRSKS